MNPNTIQKAYRELETRNFIYSIKGKGSFVNPNNQKQNNEKMEAIKKDIEKLLLEALYLGVSIEELLELIQKLDA
ncbi:hypothetical protein J7E63_13885 [Bacillus sp. ISL-75]|uniref:GntR family transcriptional regulator n=1 Tax=Bacillus sp. ISL-75 TaxID=2819137 RepID=UPI001BE955FD|nr:hypothetical protein [Bacillus sp. ISL-75]